MPVFDHKLVLNHKSRKTDNGEFLKNLLDTLFDYLKNKILSAILDLFLRDMSVFSQIFTRGCAEVTCEKNMFLQRDQNM